VLTGVSYIAAGILSETDMEHVSLQEINVMPQAHHVGVWLIPSAGLTSLFASIKQRSRSARVGNTSHIRYPLSQSFLVREVLDYKRRRTA